MRTIWEIRRFTGDATRYVVHFVADNRLSLYHGYCGTFMPPDTVPGPLFTKSPELVSCKRCLKKMERNHATPQRP